MGSRIGHALFERQAEITAIEATLDAACGDDGRVLLVEGPAGVGKTRLLEAARDRAAERGMLLMGARGAELEREFSYGIARQLLEAVVAAAPPERRAELFAGAAARVAPLFHVTMRPPPVAPAGPDAQFAALHGLFWLAANVAQDGPALLAVDDAHWADGPSLHWLAYLSRRLKGLPLALVIALRPGEVSAAQPLLEAIAAEPGTRLVRPPALGWTASERLIRAMLPAGAEPAFCRACYEAAAGNPLLLAELGRAIAAEEIEPVGARAGEILEIGPRAISRRVELRLSRLPESVTRLARAAAVLGGGAEPATAAVLAGLDEDDADRACATLVGLEILKPAARLEFVHPLVRAAVYGGIPSSERRRRHEEAARVLARSGASAEQIAAHLLLAPAAGSPAAVVTLREAALRARDRGDSAGAAAYLRRALEEPPPPGERADLLVELASVEMLVDGRAAIGHLQAALELVEDVADRAAPTEMLVRALLFAWRYEEGVALASRTIDELGDAAPEQRRRLEAAVMNATMFVPAARGHALHIADRVRARPDDDGLGARMLDGLVACVDAHRCVPAGEAVAWVDRAIRGGTLIREANGGSPLVVAGIVLTAADPDRALGLFDAMIEAALDQGSVFAFAAGMTYRSVVHLIRGDLSDAVADAERGLEAAEAHGLEAAPGFAAPNLANALLARGELDAAGDALSRAGFGPSVPDDFRSLWFRESRAHLLLLRGETRRGLEETLACGRAFEAAGGRNPAFLPWRSRAARALTTLGERTDEARRLVADELELARVWGTSQAIGAALRAQGVVEGRIQPLEQAVDALERSSARLELAAALVDLGAALRRARRRSDAREPLRRGLELAHRCGAAALADRAHAELLATGARPRRRALSGPDSLTPSERRVAEMAAAGRTNREIAEALFVTAKTVETHLGRAYAKLEIGSRQELAGLMRPGAR